MSDRFQQATLALASGRFGETLALLEGAASSAGGELVRARALAGLGRVDDAIEAARATLRLDAASTEARELIDRLDALRPDAREWAVGALVGERWEVFGAAEGGMGRVYFVHDRQWQLPLAVKTLRESLDDREHARALFLRECQLWLDLGAHPNVVTAFYTLDIGGALRFFMEYVPGRDLAAVLRAPVATVDALAYATQIAIALTFLHERGVAHRDLKPGNCLVADDGLRLTDLGLGRDPRRRELLHGSAGTPLYMAPEQWGETAAAGTEADVYAFGLMLYELFGGVHPFDPRLAIRGRYEGRVPGAIGSLAERTELDARVTPSWLRALHEHVDPLPAASLGIEMPPAIEALALRCAAKDPARRPRAADIVGALGGTVPSRAIDATEHSEVNRAVSYATMGEPETAHRLLTTFLHHRPDAVDADATRMMLEINAGTIQPGAVDIALRARRPTTNAPFARLLEVLRHVRTRGAPICELAGELVVGITSTGALFSHDLGAGRELSTVPAPANALALTIDDARDRVRVVAADRVVWFAMDGRSLATTALRGTARAVGTRHVLLDGDRPRLFDLTREAIEVELPGSGASVWGMAPDGSWVAGVDLRGKPTLHVWSAEHGALAPFTLRGPAQRVAVSARGRVAVQFAGLTRVVEPLARKIAYEIEHVTSCRWASPERLVVVRRALLGGATIAIFDGDAGSPAGELALDDADGVVVATDATRIATWSAHDDVTRLWWPAGRGPAAFPLAIVAPAAARERERARRSHGELIAGIVRAPSPPDLRRLAELEAAFPDLGRDRASAGAVARALRDRAEPVGVRRHVLVGRYPRPGVSELAWRDDTLFAAYEDDLVARRGDTVVTSVSIGRMPRLFSSPDQRVVCALSKDARLLGRWDADGHPQFTVCSAWSVGVGPDGRTILLDRSSAAELTWPALALLPVQVPCSTVDGVAVGPRGLVAYSSGERVHVGERTFDAGPYTAHALFDPDGTRLVANHRVWRLDGTLELDLHAVIGRQGSFVPLRVGARGRLLFLFERSPRAVVVVDLELQRVLCELPAIDAASVAIRGDDHAVAIGRLDRGIEVWELDYEWNLKSHGC